MRWIEMSGRTVVALGLFAVLPLSGCRVKTHTAENGKQDVDVSTPFGGVSVTSDQGKVEARMGLPVYPGAVPEKDKKTSSADVNLNLGFFELHVLAAGYSTPDSPEKVSAFYRKALAQYSDVIQCEGNHAVGSPTKTGLGLSCEENDTASKQGNRHRSANEIELRAGSASHQHIVGYEPQDGGTHFALINLQLPRGDADKDRN